MFSQRDEKFAMLRNRVLTGRDGRNPLYIIILLLYKTLAITPTTIYIIISLPR